MTSSLVGSEMCIRDSLSAEAEMGSSSPTGQQVESGNTATTTTATAQHHHCLLYTSDAADDM
eukprot:4727086-Prorocentrum_lima.AAC.1